MRPAPVDHWLYDAVIGGSAAVCLWRAFSIRSDRGAWVAIGVGITLYSLGDLYWDTYLADLASPPYPSWADAGGSPITCLCTWVDVDPPSPGRRPAPEHVA